MPTHIPTHISEMGIHNHPSYSLEMNAADRTESPKDLSTQDSLLENSQPLDPMHTPRKPILSETRILEGDEGGLRLHIRRVL
jgi:hypothetical protein